MKMRSLANLRAKKAKTSNDNTPKNSLVDQSSILAKLSLHTSIEFYNVLNSTDTTNFSGEELKLFKMRKSALESYIISESYCQALSK